MPPPRPRLLLLLVPLAVLLLALVLPRPASAAGRERWRWPLHGDVVGAFRYAPRHPFAAGARRGIDIAAPRGATVRAACPGRVDVRRPGARRPRPRRDACAAAPSSRRISASAVWRSAAGRGSWRGAPARRRSARRGGCASGRGAGRPASATSTRSACSARCRRRAGRGPGPLPLGRAPRGPLAPRLAPPPGRLAPRPARAGAGAAATPGRGVPGLAWGGLVLLAAGLPLGGLRAPASPPPRGACARRDRAPGAESRFAPQVAARQPMPSDACSVSCNALVLRHHADLLRQRGARTSGTRTRRSPPTSSPATCASAARTCSSSPAPTSTASRSPTRPSARASTPKELADRNAARFQALMPRLNASNDFFIRTTDPRHKARGAGGPAARPRQRPRLQGRSTRAGTARAARTSRPRTRSREGNRCPIHEIALDARAGGELVLPPVDLPGAARAAATPSSPTSCMPRAPLQRGALVHRRRPAGRLALARAKLTWGVAVPWDPSHVFYVWFDALLNYYTALGFARAGRGPDRPLLAGDLPRHRQGHPQVPHGLLAGDADGRRHPAARARLRPRLPARRRRAQDEQVAGQRARPVRGHRPLRHRRAALLPAPRRHLRRRTASVVDRRRSARATRPSWPTSSATSPAARSR